MTDKEANKSIKSYKNNLALTPNEIHNNSLNDSISKMQYSFNKSPRFVQDKNIIQTHFYDINTTLSKRTTSLGYGTKIDISGKKQSPSPNLYNIKSEFDNSQKKGISIGLGRKDVKSNSLFQLKTQNYPSPMSYSPKINQKIIKYSMGVKFQDKSNQWVKKVPGPGSYSFVEPINPKGSNFVSKFETTPCAKFPKLPRVGVQTNLVSPGPAKYDTSNELKAVSKFHGSRMHKFGNSKRKDIGEEKISPGPGAYNYFSQFMH